MEHGLEDIVFLCSKTYDTLQSCHNFPAGSRQAARAPPHLWNESTVQGASDFPGVLPFSQTGW